MATFVRYLRTATDMRSATEQAAEDLNRGHSFLGYNDGEGDARGEAFPGLCGYRVANASALPSNVEYEDCPWLAVFSGEYIGRDTASDGDLFAPASVIEVKHLNLYTDSDGELSVYSDEEWDAITVAP